MLITIKKGEAKGRNGYFKVKEVEVLTLDYMPEQPINIMARSKREGRYEPLRLSLSIEVTVALRDALNHALEDIPLQAQAAKELYLASTQTVAPESLIEAHRQKYEIKMRHLENYEKALGLAH